MRPRIQVLVLIALAGCVIHAGPGPGSFEPAHTAQGITTSLALASSTLRGELLEVRDTGLVVLTSDRVALVPFRAISSGVFESSSVTLAGHQAPLPSDLASLRLLSRFPQGGPAGAMKRLLASKQQDSLFVVR